MQKIILILLGLIYGCAMKAQEIKNKSNSYRRATLYREDSAQIAFTFQVKGDVKKPVLYILNGSEKIMVENIRFQRDSVFIQMPVFESAIKAKMTDSLWNGIWTKGGKEAEQIMRFTATTDKRRFIITNSTVPFNITGRWSVRFYNDSSAPYPSVAEFYQEGHQLTGTFLNPTGDFRYLEGVVTGNQLRLSTFDGGHAFLFTATIEDNNRISDGQFYSGATYKESWYAVKNKNATVNEAAVAMRLQPGETGLRFRFPDLNGQPVSINDERFRNKVVIVQLMGSWCPNCMDETKFLSDYYTKNKHRGVEVIALAYEYSTDFERSVKSLRKFQTRFNVTYPMLVTGAAIGDSLRTEKTIPQVTPILFFPTSIIIDKKGKPRKFDTGFVGPGTGIHFENYSRGFYTLMDALLKE